MQKRGQMAIIIIIAILVVVAIILLILNRGSLSITGGEALSPHVYLTSCIEPHITSTLSLQLKQGGFMIPESSVEYEGNKISYLCYTSENYKTCTVQKPMVKVQVERELAEKTSEKAKSCLDSLINEYKKRGYEVSSSNAKSSIDIVPGKIAVSIVSPLTIRKEGTQNFDRFDLSIKSEAYELLIIGESIVNYESTFGDSEITDFIGAYPNLKIEKIKIPNSIKIYRVSSLKSGERFQFASRSLVWPPGYEL